MGGWINSSQILAAAAAAIVTVVVEDLGAGRNLNRVPVFGDCRWL